MKVGDLIDALGGTVNAAKELGIGPSAVSNWRKFGVIPPQYGLNIQRLCSERGIEFNADLFQHLTDAERSAS